MRAFAAASSAVWHRLISDQSINLGCNSREAGDEGDFSFAAVVTAAAIGLSLVVAAQDTGPTFSVQTFADRTGVGSTDRDCIFYGNGSIWDSYTNGASSTGQGGQARSCATAGVAINPATNVTTSYTYGNIYTNVANRGFLTTSQFPDGTTFLSETNHEPDASWPS